MKLMSGAMNLVAKASLPVYFLVTLALSFAMLAATLPFGLPFDNKLFQASIVLAVLFLVAAIVYKNLAGNGKGDNP